MTGPTFREYVSGRDDDALITLLTSETWPLRAKTSFSRSEVLESIANGEYGTGNDLSFFIESDDRDVGLVRLEDVAAEGVDAALDIRILERWRGRGMRLVSVRFICDEFFKRHPDR